jgi:hypothetical protein
MPRPANPEWFEIVARLRRSKIRLPHPVTSSTAANTWAKSALHGIIPRTAALAVGDQMRLDNHQPVCHVSSRQWHGTTGH